MKLYQVLAQLADHYERAAFKDRKEDIDVFANDLAYKYLPHGSGFDSGCQIDMTKSSDKKLTVYSSYHPMNEAGMYIEWIYFEVIVKASLVFGFIIDVKGPFSKRDLMMLKEYIGDEFHECLNREVHVNFRSLEEV